MIDYILNPYFLVNVFWMITIIITVTIIKGVIKWRKYLKKERNSEK